MLGAVVLSGPRRALAARDLDLVDAFPTQAPWSAAHPNARRVTGGSPAPGFEGQGSIYASPVHRHVFAQRAPDGTGITSVAAS
jgi:hypothetical protein